MRNIKALTGLQQLQEYLVCGVALLKSFLYLIETSQVVKHLLCSKLKKKKKKRNHTCRHNFLLICSLLVFKIEVLIWVSFWKALKFQPLSGHASSNPRRQSQNIEMKYKTHIKLVHELYDTCFLYNVKN